MPNEPADLNKEEEIAKGNDNWENRVLCSDENCIGVIGSDGRCKECGKPGKESPAGEMDTAPVDSTPPEDLEERPAPRFDDDWENRTLCSDESCIGIIGSDGRCKECGKAYKG
jgi:hypothetical protein